MAHLIHSGPLRKNRVLSRPPSCHQQTWNENFDLLMSRISTEPSQGLTVPIELLLVCFRGQWFQAMASGVRVVQWVFISNKGLFLNLAGPLRRGEEIPATPVGAPQGSALPCHMGRNWDHFYIHRAAPCLANPGGDSLPCDL